VSLTGLLGSLLWHEIPMRHAPIRPAPSFSPVQE
jgi:hypothetical protein